PGGDRRGAGAPASPGGRLDRAPPGRRRAVGRDRRRARGRRARAAARAVRSRRGWPPARSPSPRARGARGPRVGGRRPAGAGGGRAVSWLVAPEGPNLVALLPSFHDDELFELAERAVARAGEQLGARPAAGVGRPVPAGRARETYHEARCALEARELGAPGPN